MGKSSGRHLSGVIPLRLILVRHGQIAANVRGELETTTPGPELTALGVQQATALAAALADEPVGALFASTMIRTQRTVAPLSEARALPVTVLPGLREVDAGDLTMRSDRPSVERYQGTAFGWADGQLDTVMPGAAGGREFFARYDEAVAAIEAAGAACAVAVSHGTAIRVWVAGRSTNVDAGFAAARPLTNTGAVVLEGSSAEGWLVTAWEGEALGGPAVQSVGADPTGAPAAY